MESYDSNFYEFLDRMRHPSLADLVKAIKSFILAFLASPPDPERDSRSVQEFVKKMEEAFRAHPMWAGASDEDIETTGEGIERYLMTKLYSRAFPQSDEDMQIDQELSDKISCLQQFIRPEHLDIPSAMNSDPSWLLAQKELQKINSFKAPRNKLVCILNCCTMINNILLNESMATHNNPPGADDFLPVLIYVVIKANPPQLHSNLLFIQRYRHESRLVSEAAYFYTNLVSAETFIRCLTATSLSMDPAEFERRMQRPPDAADRIQDAVVQKDAAGQDEEKQVKFPKVAGQDEQRQVKFPKAAGQDEQRQVKFPKAAGQDEERQVKFPKAAGQDGERQVKFPKAAGQNDERQVKFPNAAAQDEETQVKSPTERVLPRPSASRRQGEANVSVRGELRKQHRFLYARAGDLTVGDVVHLLADYKELVLKYAALSKAVEAVRAVHSVYTQTTDGEVMEAGSADTEGRDTQGFVEHSTATAGSLEEHFTYPELEGVQSTYQGSETVPESVEDSVLFGDRDGLVSGNKTASDGTITAAQLDSDDIVEPHSDELVEPHADELVEPQSDELVEPHSDELVEPHSNELVEPRSLEAGDPYSDETVEPHSGETV